MYKLWFIFISFLSLVQLNPFPCVFRYTTEHTHQYQIEGWIFFSVGQIQGPRRGRGWGGQPPLPHYSFSGVRMFGCRTSQRYLNLLLALRSYSWWLISLKTPIFTKLHVVVDFCSNAEFIVARFPVKSEDLLTELNGCLKQILLADDVVHDALKTRLEI